VNELFLSAERSIAWVAEAVLAIRLSKSHQRREMYLNQVYWGITAMVFKRQPCWQIRKFNLVCHALKQVHPFVKQKLAKHQQEVVLSHAATRMDYACRRSRSTRVKAGLNRFKAALALMSQMQLLRS